MVHGEMVKHTLAQKQAPRVLVLMATYNGAAYVADQIDSILHQNGVEVFLRISDDASSDSTFSILQSYAERFQNITVSQNDRNKGLACNFMDMVYQADAERFDYLSFSDQDDVWMPDKLIHAIDSIKASGGGPRLYYSDVEDVDSRLDNPHRECASYRSYVSSFKLALITNWVLGCTMVFNASFLRKVQQYRPPAWYRNHDGWFHLLAVGCGWVVPDLDHAYIFRRITGSNVVGESTIGTFSLKRVTNAFKMLFFEKEQGNTQTARYLLEGYSSELTAISKADLLAFLKKSASIFGRIQLACDNGFSGPFPVENFFSKIKMLLGLY